MHTTPTYFNADYAAGLGHDDVVVNPLLAFNVVFGMSVQDLSEAGGAFLGVSSLRFHEHVYPGETLYANSTVLDRRESDSRPHQGIVHWYTEGVRPDGSLVLEYERQNLVAKRDPPDGTETHG
jgi:acyl dehydratase